MRFNGGDLLKKHQNPEQNFFLILKGKVNILVPKSLEQIESEKKLTDQKFIKVVKNKNFEKLQQKYINQKKNNIKEQKNTVNQNNNQGLSRNSTIQLQISQKNEQTKKISLKKFNSSQYIEPKFHQQQKQENQIIFESELEQKQQMEMKQSRRLQEIEELRKITQNIENKIQSVMHSSLYHSKKKLSSQKGGLSLKANQLRQQNQMNQTINGNGEQDESDSIWGYAESVSHIQELNSESGESQADEQERCDNSFISKENSFFKELNKSFDQENQFLTKEDIDDLKRYEYNNYESFKNFKNQKIGFKKCFGHLKDYQLTYVQLLKNDGILEVQYTKTLETGETGGSLDIINDKQLSTETLIAVTDNVYALYLTKQQFKEILQEFENKKYQKRFNLLSLYMPNDVQIQTSLGFLVSQLQPIKKFKGQKLFAEGSSVEGCYIIEKGEIEIQKTVELVPSDQFVEQNQFYKINCKIQELKLSKMVSGQFIGDEEVLQNEKKRFFDAVCQAETKVYFIEISYFMKMLQDCEPLYNLFLGRVREKLKWQNQKLEEQQSMYQQQYNLNLKEELTKEKQKLKNKFLSQEQRNSQELVEKINMNRDNLENINKISKKSIKQLDIKDKAKLQLQIQNSFKSNFNQFCENIEKGQKYDKRYTESIQIQTQKSQESQIFNQEELDSVGYNSQQNLNFQGIIQFESYSQKQNNNNIMVNDSNGFNFYSAGDKKFYQSEDKFFLKNQQLLGYYGENPRHLKNKYQPPKTAGFNLQRCHRGRSSKLERSQNS
ncbi:Cyclic nucleotide-binding protein [Pseudocohnilembus persalinus]|uniref:Cyclic nucleotide-binding protein n=1 Tax=Pseudocohnilembus persalinus TaxID=266149 RepID=A0A0V0R6Q0_PSEPJ|nr:Cyclic nucleotide-binding protein [Pseudocohnilembus persalinus]|eukprot:KRX10032.1 Cyclic nucleotide-binding protein [Pseudocohnilembus persalinus]